jgi:hypothetical protein
MIDLTKKIAAILIVTPVLLAVSMPSNAAKIHNKTSATIQVYGSAIPIDTSPVPVVGEGLNKFSFNEKRTLNANTSSAGGIDWKESWGAVVLDKNDKVMCNVSYAFGRAELQGGNYLLISQDKETISCFLCSSSHKAKDTGEGLVLEESGADLEFVSPYKSCG